MGNTKERLDDLEAGLGLVQDELQKMNVGAAENFQRMENSFNNTLEDSMNRIIAMRTSNREDGATASRGNQQTEGNQVMIQGGENLNMFAPGPIQALKRHVKIEFPRFYGGDPTEWVSKAKQYFVYHEMPREQRVSFSSYHLSEEANEWCQAITKARRLDLNQTVWETFEEDLWTKFGSIDGEDFDEALSHIRQKGH